MIAINEKNKRYALLLTYAGTLPLFASLTGIALGWHHTDFVHASVLYGAVIASFLCGIHWAIYLFFSESCPFNLLFASNIIVLIIWASLLEASSDVILLVQASCFGVLMLIERMLSRRCILPEWFYKLRRNATLIVVVLLILIAFLA